LYSKEGALGFLNLFRFNESTTDGIWAHVETTPQAAISLLDSLQTVDYHFASCVPEVGESEQEESDNERAHKRASKVVVFCLFSAILSIHKNTYSNALELQT
jgi:hypothetical protein